MRLVFPCYSAMRLLPLVVVIALIEPAHSLVFLGITPRGHLCIFLSVFRRRKTKEKRGDGSLWRLARLGTGEGSGDPRPFHGEHRRGCRPWAGARLRVSSPLSDSGRGVWGERERATATRCGAGVSGISLAVALLDSGGGCEGTLPTRREPAIRGVHSLRSLRIDRVG